MGAERRLLALSALILVLVSADVLAAPSGAPAEPPGQPDSSPVTAPVTAYPVTAKTAPDQTSSSSDGTETETGRPTTAAGDTQSKLYGGSNSAASEAFFMYGAALTGLVYGLMGVSYIYGPYSREAYLAQQRAEMRKKYLERLVSTTEAPQEEDYGYYTAEEAHAVSSGGGGGLFGEIQIPAQYTITRRQDAPEYDGYGQEYSPDGVESRYGYDQEDAPFDDSRYELVMARGDPAEVTMGVNRRGPEEVIPIRLPKPSDVPTAAPLVRVLDMRSADCRAWVACLQDRDERMRRARTSLSPTDFDPGCELFVKVCPTQARSLDSITQH